MSESTESKIPLDLAENISKLFKAEDYEKVIQFCEAQDPEKQEKKEIYLYEKMALAYYKKNDIVKAKEMFKTCLSLDAENYIMMYHVGICHMLLGEMDAAIEQFVGSLKKNQNFTCAAVNQVFVLNIKGQHDLAISLYENDKSLSPMMLRNMSYAYYQKGITVRALDLIRKSTNYYPNEYQNWVIWGKILKKKLFWEEALEKYKIGVQLCNNNEMKALLERKCKTLQDLIEKEKERKKKEKSCVIF
jgi:tetratricopeptide (TPR) repeat protein